MCSSRYTKVKLLLDLESYLETKEVQFVIQTDGSPESDSPVFHCPSCHDRFIITIEIQEPERPAPNPMSEDAVQDQKNSVVEPEIQIRKVNRLKKLFYTKQSLKPSISIKCVTKRKLDQTHVFDKTKKKEETLKSKILRIKQNLNSKRNNEVFVPNTSSSQSDGDKSSNETDEIIVKNLNELQGTIDTLYPPLYSTEDQLEKSFDNSNKPENSSSPTQFKKSDDSKLNDEPKKTKSLRKFICNHCSPPATLSNAARFREHLRRLHPDIARKLELLSDIFLCSVCGKNFLTKAQYQQHVQIHLHPEKLKCEICQKVKLYFFL